MKGSFFNNSSLILSSRLQFFHSSLKKILNLFTKMQRVPETLTRGRKGDNNQEELTGEIKMVETSIGDQERLRTLIYKPIKRI